MEGSTTDAQQIEGLVSNLEERLNRIQAQLYGIESPQNCSRPIGDERCIFERTRKITNTLYKIEKSSDFVGRFFTKYNQFVEGFETSSSTVSFDEKLAILSASEGVLLETVKSLEELKENEKYINFDNMGDVPSVAPKLQRLENLLLSEQERFVELDEQQQQLLNAYNSITDILSQKFLLWDSTLTALEKQ